MIDLNGMARRHAPTLKIARLRRSAKARQRRPEMDALESRTLLAQTVVLGPLEFRVPGSFDSASPGKFTSNSGYVDVAFRSTGTSTSRGLLRVDLTGPGGGQLAIDTADPSEFELTGGALRVIAGSTDNGSPIWQAPNATTPVDFDFARFINGSGVALSEATARPFTVAGVSFQVNTIGLALATGADPSTGQVKMQGGLTLPAFRNWDLSRFAVRVDGPNFVIVDQTGTTLTGVRAGGTSETYQVGGLDLQAKIDISYSKVGGRSTFGFSGGAIVSTKPQGGSASRALNGVGASFRATVVDGQLGSLGLGLEGAFTVAGLSVSADLNNPLSFAFDFSAQQWSIYGGLTLKFAGNSIDTILGNANTPGIVIQNGQLTSFHAVVRTSFTLLGAQINTVGGGLGFQYNAVAERFEMGGGLELVLPGGGANGGGTNRISGQLGTPGAPGLIITRGELTSIQIALSGRLDLFGLSIGLDAAGVRYDAPVPPASVGVLEIYGAVSVSIAGATATASLGNAATPGLILKNGVIQVENFAFDLSTVNLGAFVIQDLRVSYLKGSGPNDYTIDVGLMLQFPGAGGWGVGGSIAIVDGRLEAIALDYDAGNSEGLPIGDTGLFITHFGGSVANIDNPANIVVTASIDVVFGKQISILGRQAAILHAHGDVTVDKDELKLDADVEFGAYRNGDGSYSNLLGGGKGSIDLDWATGVYTATADVELVDDIFDVSFQFSFAAGRDIRIVAIGAVQIPPAVPLIGGTKLGEVGVFFEYVWPQGDSTGSTTFAAWIGLDVIWKFDVGFEYRYDDAGKHFSLIGTSTVDTLLNPPKMVAPQTYEFSTTLAGAIPADATGETLRVEIPAAASGTTIVGSPQVFVRRVRDGKLIPASQFNLSTNGLAALTTGPLVDANSRVVRAIGSATDPYQALRDQYTLVLRVQATGGNPFPTGNSPKFTTTHSTPTPLIGAPIVPSVPLTGAAVLLGGRIDSDQLASGFVSLYLVQDADPTQTGILIGKSSLTSAGGSATTWTASIPLDLRNTFPVGYHLTAIVDDGASAPVRSALSRSFEPIVAVAGSVSNQLGQPLGGWTVFLDYNSNGTQDPDEPDSLTDLDGEYTFPPRPIGSNPVPIGIPFRTVLVNLDPTQYDIPMASDPAYYSGSSAAEAAFSVRQRTTVGGVLFIDANGTGSPLGQAPLAGLTVFDDVNRNGRRDPGETSAVSDPSGGYALAGLSPGVHSIVVALPANLFATRPTGARSVTIAPGGFSLIVGQDFGLAPYSTISGTVTRDDPAGGSPTPVAGATITIQGGPNPTTVSTRADGSYTATVRPGVYVVGLNPPAGTVQLSPSPSGGLAFPSPPDGTALSSFTTVPSAGGYRNAAHLVADFDGDDTLDLLSVAGGIWSLAPDYTQSTGPYISPFGGTLPGQVAGNSLTYSLTMLRDPTTGRINFATAPLSGNVGDRLIVGRFVGGTNVAFSTFQLDPGSYAVEIIGGNFTGRVRDDLAVQLFSPGVNKNDIATLTLDISGNLYPDTRSQIFNGPPKNASNLAVGDYNRDGRDDLWYSLVDSVTRKSQVSIIGFPATGRLSIAVRTPDGQPWLGGLAVGDVNHDGRLDFAISKAGKGAVAIAIQGANGGFPASSTTTLNTVGISGGISHLELADLNGDDYPELVAAGMKSNSEDGSIFALENLRNRLFGGPIAVPNVTYFGAPSVITYLVSQAPQGGFRSIASFQSVTIPSLSYFNYVSIANTAPFRPGTYTLAIPVATSPTAIDFSIIPTPTIAATLSGVLFDDRDGDGSRSAGETGLGGVPVYLDINRDGQYQAGEPIAVTGPGGAFTFPGLADGSYRVGLLGDPSHRLTGPGGVPREGGISGGSASNVGLDLGRSPRTIVPVDVLSGSAGRAIVFRVGRMAVGGNRLFSLAPGSPAGASINPRTGVFRWTPRLPGTYAITVLARNRGNGTITSETFTVVVPSRDLQIARLVVSRIAPKPGSMMVEATIRATLANVGSRAGRLATIDWGDGSPPETFDARGSIAPRHHYAAGRFVATLTLSTRRGEIASRTLLLDIPARIPVASVAIPLRSHPGGLQALRR